MTEQGRGILDLKLPAFDPLQRIVPRKLAMAHRHHRHKRILPTPKDPLEIPISEQARKVLKQQRRLARAKNQEVGNGDCVPTPSDRIFITEQGGPLINWSRWLRGNAKRCAVAGWSAHALRRTAATIAGDLGAPPHVISAMLGHSNIGGQLIAGYNKSRYREEHAALIQLIGSRIDQIVKGRPQKTNSAQ